MPEPVPDFPLSVKIEYLAEGAANVVYTINHPSMVPWLKGDGPVPIESDCASTGAIDLLCPAATNAASSIPSKQDKDIPQQFRGKLLRLRKDIPSTPLPEVSNDRFEKIIRPLLPAENIVEQELVRIPRNFTEQCNTYLKQLENANKRPLERRGIYHPENESFGLLIMDMTPQPEGQMLVSFKPKWLLQSPTAPMQAIRCRTCALQKMRDLERVKRGGKPKEGLCPMDLVSGEEERVQEAVRRFIAPHQPKWKQQKIAKFLLQNPLLPLMRKLQHRLDEKGILNAENVTEDFLTAMTLRDCSLYIKVPLPEMGEVEARFGDLDLKKPTPDKLRHWKDIERRLIREGWYEKPVDELYGQYMVQGMSDRYCLL